LNWKRLSCHDFVDNQIRSPINQIGKKQKTAEKAILKNFPSNCKIYKPSQVLLRKNDTQKSPFQPSKNALYDLIKGEKQKYQQEYTSSKL
jgi:hypothetical protein